MSWRFRRSKGFGPFRLTATKSGLSLSAGGPLGRVSVNTRGQVRETTRVPGVGLYQTKQVAQLGAAKHSTAATTRGRATTPEATVTVSVTAQDIAGAVELDPTDPGVVSLRLVSLVDPLPHVAEAVGIVRDDQGFVHGSREGLVMPEGSEWHAFVLIHPEDHAHLAPMGTGSPALAMHVGRLSARDVRRWAARFAGRPLHVSAFIEATPGVEVLEVRFRPELLTEPSEPATALPAPAGPMPAPVPAEPLPPAAWYADPADSRQWRYWDGRRWTTYTAPR